MSRLSMAFPAFPAVIDVFDVKTPKSHAPSRPASVLGTPGLAVGKAAACIAGFRLVELVLDITKKCTTRQ